VKAACFIASGVKIGITGSQELRWWGMEIQVIIIMISFLLLCGVGGSLIYNSKEMVILQVLLVIVIFVGWKYTKVFISGVGRTNGGLVKMKWSVCMIFVSGRSGFRGMEMVITLMMIGRVIPVLNSWSGYVVNK